MTTEEEPEQATTAVARADTAGGRAGFVSGFIMGVLVGAGFALLFAPEQGQKTRGRLRRRVRSLREDARDGIDRAGSRTRKELQRRRRRLRAELERVRERARDALD
jgi:gas vesicle protein